MTKNHQEAPDKKLRCQWASGDALLREYHDIEWGVPLHGDQALFELLILEGAQAGLSWLTILRKRAAYRKAFDEFDPERIARYSETKIERLLENPGIVRNRLKVIAAVQNAKSFLAVRQEFGTFDRYIWQFVGKRPMDAQRQSAGQVPARTTESDAMSKDLSKRGFKFTGSTICYAFMQAAGLVNDHLVECFRYQEVSRAKRRPAGVR